MHTGGMTCEHCVDETLDLAVVGGGSAGFAAAIKAAELGARVAIVERGTLGGTCVNVGCVPSKALVRAAETVFRVRHHPFAGVRTHLDGVNLADLVAQKDRLVEALRRAKYEDVLAAYPTIRLLKGRASFRPDGTLAIDGAPLRADKVVLALGARPWVPPIPGLADVPFLTSTEALDLTELPRRLLVVGASAVGLELAQLFARFGTEVTVLEVMARIVPAEDAELAEALAGYLRQEGLAIQPSATIERVGGGPGAYRVDARVDGAARRFEADALLVATGRRPNTHGMGLEQAGIALGPKGEILVDEHLETRRPGVYAAGDAIGDPMFVYVAAHAGALAAENALRGNTRRYDLSVVPRVTFSDPALAAVGLTETEARARGLDVAVARLPLAHVPRALVAHDTRGLIKLVAEKATGRLLGAHVLAPEAGEMIQEAALAMAFGIPVAALGAMLHPYLTYAEAIKLAAQAFTKDVAKLSCCAA